MDGLEDTIAAISTPVGEGGIGIVRISGSKAPSIVKKIFKRPAKKKIVFSAERTMLYGYIVNPQDGAKVDEVLVTIMKPPRTYTREWIVEINCHSGIRVLREILEIVLSCGARLAEPGEFTKRAFLRGRIDLAQAEAVADLIYSKTEASRRAAFSQLEGGLSQKIKGIRSAILEVLAHLEAAVDFSDEDIETLPASELVLKARECEREIKKLLASAEAGKVLREGVATAIVGKPNVGKSSLLNALLREKRAIVTSVPGTTRDLIEETVSIKGIPLRLQDTAGIRHPKDEVEEMGVEIARKRASLADLVLFVVDASQPLTKEDFAIMREIEGKRTIVVLNKVDLARKISKDEAMRRLKADAVVETSALRNQGIDELERTIFELVFSGKTPPLESSIVTNLRHQQALRRAKKELEEGIKALKRRAYEEVVVVFFKKAIEELGRITGETVGEEVLNEIFSRFCIGK